VPLPIGKSASIPYTTRFRGPDESAAKMVSEVGLPVAVFARLINLSNTDTHRPLSVGDSRLHSHALHVTWSIIIEEKHRYLISNREQLSCTGHNT